MMQRELRVYRATRVIDNAVVPQILRAYRSCSILSPCGVLFDGASLSRSVRSSTARCSDW